MRKLAPWALALLVASGTALGHWWLAGCGATACAAPCDAGEVCPAGGPAAGYWASGEGFIGLSYGLGFGFLALLTARRVLALKRGGLRATAAGLAGAGVVWLAVCWLTGCCGSPLLPLYVSWIGGEFLGITGPLVFGLTAALVVLSAAWLRRSCRHWCNCAEPCAESEGSHAS